MIFFTPGEAARFMNPPSSRRMDSENLSIAAARFVAMVCGFVLLPKLAMVVAAYTMMMRADFKSITAVKQRKQGVYLDTEEADIYIRLLADCAALSH